MESLIVINGPIAAGKSAVAQVLAQQLRQRERPTAVVDLDLLYRMMSDTKPMADPSTWLRARRAAAALTDCFLSSGVQAVIVEGQFWNKQERAPFLNMLNWAGDPRFVTLLVSYEEAFRRVQGDPTRTTSRSPDFLRTNHANFEANLGSLKLTDLVLDSTSQTTQQLGTAILKQLMPQESIPDAHIGNPSTVMQVRKLEQSRGAQGDIGREAGRDVRESLIC